MIEKHHIDVEVDRQRFSCQFASSPRPKDDIVLSSTYVEKKRKKGLATNLDGVVFAVSGFPATVRDDIRRRVVAMGAKYRHHWDDTCTHLVCKSGNAPKYQMAASRGTIVFSIEALIEGSRSYYDELRDSFLQLSLGVLRDTNKHEHDM